MQRIVAASTADGSTGFRRWGYGDGLLTGFFITVGLATYSRSWTCYHQSLTAVLLEQRPGTVGAAIHL